MVEFGEPIEMDRVVSKLARIDGAVPDAVNRDSERPHIKNCVSRLVREGTEGDHNYCISCKSSNGIKVILS